MQSILRFPVFIQFIVNITYVIHDCSMVYSSHEPEIVFWLLFRIVKRPERNFTYFNVIFKTESTLRTFHENLT